MFTEYRGMWVSFLEYEQMDFSSAQAFEKDFDLLASNCKSLGLNTLIVHLRPFGDALYQSRLFPSSHLITGHQGDKMPFDPLAIMLGVCKNHGLGLEGWINPYRVMSPARKIDLHPKHIALKWMRADEGKALQRVIPWEGGIYFNPASQDVRSLIAKGVEEIVAAYPLKGIQFDDYFYPTTAPAFDQGSWQGQIDEANLQEGLASWRREQVSQMVQKVYQQIKATRPDGIFGISPQGDRAINLNQAYCDIDLWQREEGYLDYVMPQLYWGFHQMDTPGAKDFSASLQEWKSLPRHQGVRLYAGLGAYHIGHGDGHPGNQDQWQGGEQLARMVKVLRKEDFEGFALFRYHSLFPFDEKERNVSLTKKERKTLLTLL